MQTSKPIQTKPAFSKYAVHFVSIVAFYAILLFVITSLLGPVVYHFAPVSYIPDPSFRKTIAALLIIYVLFCYFGNNFVLHLYDRPKKLFISMLADLLIAPLAIALTLVYNHLTVKDHLLSIADIYNIYIITGLQVIKLLIAIKILSSKK